MARNDGGPAFARGYSWYTGPDGNTEHYNESSGMSLRDYFAGQAMIACMSSPTWVKGLDAKAAEAGVTLAEALADLTYQYADAMIAERNFAQQKEK